MTYTCLFIWRRVCLVYIAAGAYVFICTVPVISRRIYRYGEYNVKVDVWGVGITSIELAQVLV